MQALARAREVCQRRGVRRLAAVATAAVRDAENGPEFLERVRTELDIPLRVIDADTEAQLSYRSVAHHFRLDDTQTLVADIGGGSLELVGAVNGLVELSLSLPLGAVRMTDLHFGDGRQGWREVENLRADARKQLKKALPYRDWSGATIIGSGGTFTSLGRMAIARRGLPIGDTVHGTAVTAAEVEQLLEWLTTKAPEHRRGIPGLNPERADIILAGLAVAAELLDLTEARGLTVSAFGIREGLLLEMVGADTPAVEPDRLRLLREFVERCQVDRRHVEHVRLLALALFDQLGPELGCGPEERTLLEAAGLLHDVGQLVSYRKHHRHSYQLIMHADRLNLSARDRAIVALVSRYHRRKGPSRKHAEFAALPPDEQQIVRRLSGLLRVADGLDRGHTAAVDRVDADVAPGRCTIRVAPKVQGADVSLEIWGASRKADVLAKALGREVLFEVAQA
jgi:exopolyphosphatase/guanosine-5'-triphosphate,3'-diphosphate pyrophosphatase